MDMQRGGKSACPDRQSFCKAAQAEHPLDIFGLTANFGVPRFILTP